MWGASPLQRLRLAPLYVALRVADALSRAGTRRVPATAASWRPGVSVVIPDRDAPQMLAEALASVYLALELVDEPHQVVVVANGAPIEAYAEIRAAFPELVLSHSLAPLGFSAAIANGLGRVQNDWTFLMNNDVTLDRGALRELASHRAADRFSLSAQIFQQSADGRREETGFTDWYADRSGVHAYHADIPFGVSVHRHLAGSGGATLFRTEPLARYVRDSRVYDPFYWEDIEWGMRARRDGFDVLFCPAAHAFHRHRATTSRFYDAAEIDRVVARNAVLFDARNRASRFGAAWLMDRVCDLPYVSQRELSRATLASSVLRARIAARTDDPRAPPVLTDPLRRTTRLASSFSYRLRGDDSTTPNSRPRLLVVTPFAAFPPRHGGARRVAGLLASLKRDFDIVLVSDEASLYDARSFAGFHELRAVYLVQREDDAPTSPSDALDLRMRAHAHPALREAVAQAIAHHRPAVVQVEHAELAPLVELRNGESRWVLDLHDAIVPQDFAAPDVADRFARQWVAAYDAVVVCSTEDRGLTDHRNVVCVPNASSIELRGYRPSAGAELLFMGPFRYAQNLAGVRQFLADAFPAIRAAVAHAGLTILGGDGAASKVDADAAFAQPGVTLLPHRDDVRALLDASALTINPLTGIRGSSIKVVESLTAGRVCVSTVDGARGFADAGLSGLVIADNVAAMAAPIIRLLSDDALRHRCEAPDPTLLDRYQWSSSADLMRKLYAELISSQPSVP